MKRLDELIIQARTQTSNLGATVEAGIPDAEFIYYINDAQTRAQSIISAVYTPQFEDQIILDIVGNQETYSLPEYCFASRVRQVEFSPTGNTQDYRLIRKAPSIYRYSVSSSYPTWYIKQGNAFYLSPIPGSSIGKLRITYERELDALDIRRGTIESFTASGASPELLTIVLAEDDVLSDAELALCDYVSLNDRYGTVYSYAIPVSSYDATTRTITVVADTLTPGAIINGAQAAVNTIVVDSGFTLTGGDIAYFYDTITSSNVSREITATTTTSITVAGDAVTVTDNAPITRDVRVGDYVTCGKYSTTHSKLPNVCERYLVAYCAWKILGLRDSSDDQAWQEKELQAIQQDILETFNDQDRDITEIPILDDYWFL